MTAAVCTERECALIRAITAAVLMQYGAVISDADVHYVDVARQEVAAEFISSTGYHCVLMSGGVLTEI